MPDLMPWGATELSKLKDNFDRLFAALCEDLGIVQAAFPEGGIRVVQKDGEWVIVCPLPGIEPEDVTVTSTGRVLSIVAVRKSGRGAGMIRLSQELALPFPIDQARAELEGGVLTVRLARQTPPAARAIPVGKKQGGAQCPPSTNAAVPAQPPETDRST
ncbi:Hsp20/alpha crystallin family protein [Solidesulfovibrio sp.]|uniref:Hsp20/alpha crystallin family protein n=1 Tax=Solidesulfovibrio sp. TaxID=2910990 RepID=UPI002625EC6C|nr:Hsp20/alpha crystallin family protein [Solidesulfovibrio sp.]